jgi:hypothetical protein
MNVCGIEFVPGNSTSDWRAKVGNLTVGVFEYEPGVSWDVCVSEGDGLRVWDSVGTDLEALVANAVSVALSDDVINLDAPALPYDDCPADRGEIIDLTISGGAPATFSSMTPTAPQRWSMVTINGRTIMLPDDNGEYVWRQDARCYTLHCQ